MMHEYLIAGWLRQKPKNYFIVSIHREENVDYEKHFSALMQALLAIEHTYNLPVIVSTHPRTKKRLEMFNITIDNANIKFLPPLGFYDYVHLMQNAFCAVSDSGTITEESSILNFPAITIRQAHERPEGMDEGTLIMSGLRTENVLKAIEIMTDKNLTQRINKKVADYDVDYVSHKVLRIILSYTDYINRVVWHKY